MPRMMSTATAFVNMSKCIFPKCGGRNQIATTPAQKVDCCKGKGSLQPIGQEAHLNASRSLDSSDSKVFIDRETEVPLELYEMLVEAGKSARARGQHHKVRPRARTAGGSSASLTTHLVQSSP
mmetsp:Transcript_15013/g.41944  ORF Transcript_15013/g.41944 Transcript_15013/m.41944 type:complete len:123 (-) Transcript_15013:58-426(-)